MGGALSHLARILERKRREIQRRHRHAQRLPTPPVVSRVAPALEALRRPDGAPPRVIAEVKFRSPSAGAIHPHGVGVAVEVARGYAASGAAAVSVLCDGPGFGGSVLTLRRVASAVSCPVLFKEFVLDEIQLDVAALTGASLVLLLVRALEPARLRELVDGCLERGLAPVVEAANVAEVEAAQETAAPIIGVNARDLASFEVDAAAARHAISAIETSRVRVFMSGIEQPADLSRVAECGADAALIGTGLMRHADPGARLAELLDGG